MVSLGKYIVTVMFYFPITTAYNPAKYIGLFITNFIANFLF